MPVLNASCIEFRALVRRSYYTHNTKDHGNIFDEVMVFGIQSMPGRILTFHCLWDFGMIRARVPLSELYMKKDVVDVPLHYKQLWNCYSENFAITVFRYIEGNKCKVILKDGSMVWATYMFTVDWYDCPLSNIPQDAKSANVCFTDSGFLVAQPNNRLIWTDQSFVTRDFPVERKEIKVDNQFPSVESYSDKWITEDSDCFYYDIKSQPCPTTGSDKP
jgi:hypothetical protein